jgi:hypothetical protein
MKTHFKIEKIKLLLPVDEPFSKKMLMDSFVKNGDNLTNENLDVRINRFKAKGIIVSVGRGWYRFNDKKLFEPEISPSLKKLSAKLKKGFPFLNYILWSSHWLNELTTLQLFRNLYVIEVESGSEEAVFRTMKEDSPFRFFLNPKENEWENYKADTEDNIIIKTMISESPNVKSNTIKIAKLEKILVDLYCDKFWKTIFSSELNNIYTEACTNYAINFSTLLSYAGRRGKRAEIWEYIKSLEILEVSTIEMMEK